MSVLPMFIATNAESLKNVGYLGFFIANYFGYGVLILPFMINTHNIFLLILIGAFGNTIDEFFAWLAGRMIEEIESKSKVHQRIERFVMRYGLKGVFVMGVLPLPGILYDIAGFAMGHYKTPYLKVFLAGFLGKLLRWIILVFIVKIFV